MIKDISEFNTKYKLYCEPARAILGNSIKQYNQAMEEFIKKNICYDKPFDEVYKNAYLDCLSIYGRGSDNLTNEMIYEFIISEFECSLLEE